MRLDEAQSSPSISAEGLGFAYPRSRPLFSELDFTLVPDASYALIGPSGSGKSTLLGLLAGWMEPTQGRLVRRGVGRASWVFQNPVGVPARTAVDHVALPLLARGLTVTDARREARSWLTRLELEHLAASPFRELSGGEAQRLMLARAMAGGPQLLLVDEPTAQLDQRTALTVIGALAALRDTRTIVVVATHDVRTRDSCTDAIELGVGS